MFKKIKEIFSIKDLRSKLGYTFLLIVVYRIGAVVPTPGVDGHALAQFFATVSGGGNSLLGVMNLFSGGAMQKCTIFALGVMPYISSSIILQLLTVVIPSLEKLSKEGEHGQRKINQYTRYGTVLLSIVQSMMIGIWLQNPTNFQGFSVVHEGGPFFLFSVILTLTAGTAFVMWLGERITEKGIGNGMSLIIGVGILARAPYAFAQMYTLISPFHPESRQIQPIFGVVMIFLFLIVLVSVVYLLQGHRRIPIHYTGRVAGNGNSSVQNSFLPLRVNQAGVIPIIFASSVLMFPSTMSSLVPGSFFKDIAGALQFGKPLYLVIEAFLIIFFTFFYTAITFNTVEVSENLRRNSGVIPGIRQGKQTSDFLEDVLLKITTSGSIFLALVAIFPGIIYSYAHIPFSVASFFGGTGLLIVVGVMLEAFKKIESFLLVRKYDGFLSTGRIKGRL